MRIGCNTANKCPYPKATSFQRDLTPQELEGLKNNNANSYNKIQFYIRERIIRKEDLSNDSLDFFYNKCAKPLIKRLASFFDEEALKSIKK